MFGPWSGFDNAFLNLDMSNRLFNVYAWKRGESSGIELALRVVERYFGSQVVKDAAYNMEYRRTPRPQSSNDV
jgi:hypothetical protein